MRNQSDGGRSGSAVAVKGQTEVVRSRCVYRHIPLLHVWLHLSRASGWPN